QTGFKPVTFVAVKVCIRPELDSCNRQSQSFVDGSQVAVDMLVEMRHFDVVLDREGEHPVFELFVTVHQLEPDIIVHFHFCERILQIVDDILIVIGIRSDENFCRCDGTEGLPDASLHQIPQGGWYHTLKMDMELPYSFIIICHYLFKLAAG